MVTQRSKGLEITAFVLGLFLIGVGLAAWLSQYYTFDFGDTDQSESVIDEPAGTKEVECGCLMYSDGRLETVLEGSLQACSVEGAHGICAHGTSTCVDCEWTACQSMYAPTEETCNGFDDDCDGETDEGSFSEDLELCDDDFDNDCDGETDEVVCRRIDFCGDGVDNDENGKVDDGCECIVGSISSCKTNLPGVCSAGEMICPPDGRVSGICEPLAFPYPELCGNDLDDDCDDVVDEDCL